MKVIKHIKQVRQHHKATTWQRIQDS